MSGRRNLVFAEVVCFVVLGLLCSTTIGLKVVFCEWQLVTLYCASGTTLRINDATYGRDNPYTCCVWPYSTAKCSKSVTTILKPKCDGKGVCQFQVSNAVLGSDPCTNVYKYVTVDYQCIAGVAGIVTTQIPSIPGSAVVKKAVACEHMQLQITCPTGKRVDIIKAAYGRSDSTTCPIGYFYSTNCINDVKVAVSAIGLGRQSYTVTANNAIAGNVDPCPGTYKYLSVEYRCL